VVLSLGCESRFEAYLTSKGDDVLGWPERRFRPCPNLLLLATADIHVSGG